MAIDKIGVYDAALRFLGEPDLANITDTVESRYVLDNAYDDAINFMLRQAAWRFALATETVTGATSSLIPGYDHSFTKPTKWMWTHAIFVLVGADERPIDFREQGAKWYANLSSLTCRYISTDGQALATWTEQFAKAMAAYLAFLCCDKITGDPDRTKQVHSVFQELLQAAINQDAIPDNPWLPFQMDGSLLSGGDYLLEQGLWKWAIKTVSLTPNVATPSAGFSYAFDKPTDWIRTVQIYYVQGVTSAPAWERCEIDFRDEGGDYHANYTPIIVRYLSLTLGRDSTQWSNAYQDTLLAYMTLQRVAADPQTPPAVLQARQLGYERMFENARAKDDMRERPRVHPASRLTRARRGGLSTFYQREQGWGW